MVVFSCNRIQSGPDVFDKSKFVVTILGVTEILCSFRLVPEGKTGKEMLESSKLEFPEKTLAKNFALSDADDNTSWLLNRRYSKFTFAENNISNLPKVLTVKFGLLLY